MYGRRCFLLFSIRNCYTQVNDKMLWYLKKDHSMIARMLNKRVGEVYFPELLYEWFKQVTREEIGRAWLMNKMKSSTTIEQ